MYRDQFGECGCKWISGLKRLKEVAAYKNQTRWGLFLRRGPYTSSILYKNLLHAASK